MASSLATLVDSDVIYFYIKTRANARADLTAVSYTHLTLPTKA